MRYLAIVSTFPLLASCRTPPPRPLRGEGPRLVSAPIVRPGRKLDANMVALTRGSLVVRVTTTAQFPANLLTVQISNGQMSSGLTAVGPKGSVVFTPTIAGVYTIAVQGPGFVSQFINLALSVGFADTLDVQLAPP
jgi:hypothetical protein